MKNSLFKKLFSHEIYGNNRIYISKNEIYTQLLLYTFSCVKKDLLIVVSTLNEATELYKQLHEYTDDIYLFPEDDFMTKKAIATSPELLFMRLKILNDISKSNKKIVIVHLNSFIKKLPDKQKYLDNKIIIKKNQEIDRDTLINHIISNGYKRESIVSSTSEFAVRGHVIDIFPIHSECPLRIEIDFDKVESIKEFDENTQTTGNEVEKIVINTISEDFSDNKNSIIDYLNDPLVVYQDYNQIVTAEKLLKPQIDYLQMQNQIFNLKELKKNTDIQIDTIDNIGKYDLKINAVSIQNYNSNEEKFIEDIIRTKGVLYSNRKELSKKYNGIKVVKEHLNNGFIFDNNYYYSDSDLYQKELKTSLNSGYRMGKKIDSVDKIKIGDYVVHKKSGIGIYKGINVIEKNGIKKDYLLIQYKGEDKLYVPVEDIDKLYKYSSKEGVKPVIHKLNSIEWTKTKLRIKERIKSITGELIEIYKKRNLATIEPFMKDDENQLCFENEFEYEETIDQIKVANEIKSDMEKPRPMERLLCGDVGYGKTEVIFRAIFKAIINKKQVAYLCPTTILSKQQYDSAMERFKNYGINIDIVNRHYTNKEIQIKLLKLKEGKTDIVFGTHRLLSKDVIFKDLGLLVIDEEHRFGVEQKEKIKEMKSNVHVLSVSATPIPRSLQMSLVGIRDLSLIESAPKNRYPVQTYVIEYNQMLLREVILKEISRNGQAFIIYNNIFNMEKKVRDFKKLIPEARICYAHGKMAKEEMQEVIYDFTDRKYDVLVSTTIIENGIDIPNANTIIVIDSDRFGLSQLYQIRGRVGRSDRIAYAYLMYKSSSLLSSIAKKRLEAIKEFTELGSGYKISMRDLSIRGAGDILGKEQAGFIDSVGVDMYLELINEEIEGKVEEDEEVKKSQVDVQTHIDEEYSEESSILIDLHKQMNTISKKEEINIVLNSIKDKFGFVDEKLRIYAYNKYLEILLSQVDVKILTDNNIKTTLQIKKSYYSDIKIDELFTKAMAISNKFNFTMRGTDLNIDLLKASLEKNYIYYLVECLELIYKLKKGV